MQHADAEAYVEQRKEGEDSVERLRVLGMVPGERIGCIGEAAGGSQVVDTRMHAC